MSNKLLPEVFLTIKDADWPNCPPLPIGTGRVGNFEVERQIVAANMPGQVRTRTGFSIGHASVAIRQTEDRPLAPWAKRDRRITSGQECELFALDEVTGERFDLGAWRTQVPAGALSRADVAVELFESQYAGRQAEARLPVVAGPVDPVWIVDQLARQAGFHSSPPPTADTLLSVPLRGGLAGSPRGGSANAVHPTAGANPSWSMVTGGPGLAAATVLPTWPLEAGADFRRTLLTANVAGTVVFQIKLAEDTVDVQLTPGTIRVRRNGGAWSSTQSFTAGLNPNWPMRVQVVIERSGATLTFRARSSSAGALSTAVSVTPATISGIVSVGVSSISSDGGVAALDVTAAEGSPTTLWAAPTARLSLLHGTIDAPWLPQGGDVWTALQRVCDAFAGAGWVSKDRLLTVRNRHEMAGTNRPKTIVDVGTRVEDLEWTLDADDYADRLTVSWQPVTWKPTADEWEYPIEGRVHVPAGRSVTVKAEWGEYVATLASWAYISSAGVGQSQWDANTAADGSGVSVSTGISVTTEQLSPSTARITISNSTAADVWMVGFDGSPAMILRGSAPASQEAEQTIEHGTSAADARSPLDIPLGKLVQRREDAEALSIYLWERVNRPRFRVSGIRMPLDWTRDLGDVLTLVHPDSDLSANVLVVSDRKNGKDGEIQHRCDLILLPPTLADFRAAWMGRTLNDVKAAWAGSNLATFADDPLKTEA